MNERPSGVQFNQRWVASAMRIFCVAIVSLPVQLGCQRYDETKERRRPNILLISLDTLRADHLGLYGYERNTSPHIDAFAEDAVVFDYAYSSSYHTADSHMSVFTSQQPSVHRVQNAIDPREPLVVLSRSIPTVTEILQSEGYRTVGFHGGGNVEGSYGFSRGFDSYEYNGDKGVGEAISWLNQHGSSDAPFFLFFHTYHTHDPYTPLPPFDTLYDPDYEGDVWSDKRLFDGIIEEQGFNAARDAFWEAVNPEDPADIRHVQALYDGEINEVDIQIGALLDLVLEEFPDTLIVLMSDHGEAFFEHGLFLHNQLYEECLHVPLVIRRPGGEGSRRIPYRVSLIDLAPTLLDLAGIQNRETFQGFSLVDLMNGGGPRGEEIFAEKVHAAAGNQLDELTPRHMALYSRDLKGLMTDHLELFDLESDPREHRDLAAEHPAAATIRKRLDQIAELNNQRMLEFYASEEEVLHHLSAEEVDRLRALGYFNDTQP